MERKTGIWIDHSRAMIFQISEEQEELTHMARDGDETTRSLAGERTPRTYTRNDFVAEGHLERKEASRYQAFYDEVIKSLKDVQLVAVIGPGEAKGEFVKRIIATCPNVQIGSVASADKMMETEFKRYMRDQFRTTDAQ